MQYKVVGWTEYDAPYVTDAPLSDAAARAIIEDIRAHGYCFSGFDHQERYNGAPVLNDGRRRAVSQRTFAGLMAEAHGESGDYAYSAYLSDIPEGSRVMPTARYAPGAMPEPPVRDVFPYADVVFPLDLRIRILYNERFRYLDVGDILRISTREESRDYTITKVDYLEDKGEIYALKLQLSL